MAVKFVTYVLFGIAVAVLGTFVVSGAAPSPKVSVNPSNAPGISILSYQGNEYIIVKSEIKSPASAGNPTAVAVSVAICPALKPKAEADSLIVLPSPKAIQSGDGWNFPKPGPTGP